MVNKGDKKKMESSIKITCVDSSVNNCFYGSKFSIDAIIR
jgi:hypothetical protein